jgi:hypothetical protein
MAGIFRYRQSARASREEVEVIDVVAGPGYHRVETGANENGVAVLGADGDVA